MPGGLIEANDRQTIKRAVPKSSNKIHAAGIAKLYVAYPNKQKWTYTGLQGAAVLANDTVGNTFWLKLVDVSPANRGVIWDQEIYDSFNYNQDRVFFHSFELEECMAGLLFADDKEAKKFKQKMDEREKSAHKNTKNRPFSNSAGQLGPAQTSNGDSHNMLGGVRGLFGGHRHSSSQHSPQPQAMMPPRGATPTGFANQQSQDKLKDVDPEVLEALMKMGITQEQLAENADFIHSYVSQGVAGETPMSGKRPSAPAPALPISPQDTGGSKRAPPPAPPPQSRSAAPSTPPRDESPVAAPDSGPKRLRVPPALMDAGKFSKDESPRPPPRDTAPTSQPGPGPPPPPRPAKIPLDDSDASSPAHHVPPAFPSERRALPPSLPSRGSGPSLPARGAVPPPPPARDTGSAAPPPPPRDFGSSAPPPPPRDIGSSAPPPLPPKIPDSSSSAGPPPPPPRAAAAAAAPPPPPPSRNMPAASTPVDTGPPPPPPARRGGGGRSVPPPPAQASVPPPPPARTANTQPPPPPPMPSSSGPPPPPPMPSSSGPPPPPPMPAGDAATANAPALPPVGSDRSGLMADIRGGARLKKVSDKDKSDRSDAIVGGGGGGGGGGGDAGGGAGAGAAAQGGLAGALASALAQRKAKVSHSDDEDSDDAW